VVNLQGVSNMILCCCIAKSLNGAMKWRRRLLLFQPWQDEAFWCVEFYDESVWFYCSLVLDAPRILIKWSVSLALQHFLKTGHWIMATTMRWHQCLVAFAVATFFQHGLKKPSVVQIVLKTVAEGNGFAVIRLLFAWLLRHPSDICPCWSVCGK